MAEKELTHAQIKRQQSGLAPVFTSKDLKQEFERYSRQPFVECLAEIIQCVPEREALQEFANQYPDRWANAVKTMASLSGYHDKLEIENNIYLDIQGMGDAELLSKLDFLDAQLIKQEASDKAKVIEYSEDSENGDP